MITMGAKSDTVDKLYRQPNGHEMTTVERQQNPTAKHFIGQTHDRYLTQLSPGQQLDTLKERFIHYLNLEVRLEQDPLKARPYHIPKARTVSLLQFCRDVIIRCNTNILFGERLLEIDPNLPNILCDFDNDHWMILYKMPWLLAKDVHSSRRKIQDDFKEYLSTPRTERRGEAWLIQTMDTGMRELGLSEEEMATQFLLVYWS